MKKNVWKIVLLILIGILSCHVKMLGCFPFVAIWFIAVYMEGVYRNAFVTFMYLWMMLWLPIASLCRYGISLLVWMVVIAIAQRMHINMKRITQSVLAGLIMIGVCYGGTLFTAMDMQTMIIAVLEGMLVAGLGFVLNRMIAGFLQWNVGKQPSETKVSSQVQSYSVAMSGLAKSIGEMVHPNGEEEIIDVTAMRRELRQRICGSCTKCSLCFSQTGDMAATLDLLVETIDGGEEISEDLRRRIYMQCERAEVLIHEAVNIFEKMELNISWYRRLCEHREMIAGQINAMAYVMGECIEEEKLCDDKERWHILQMHYYLKDAGLKVSKIHIFKRKNGIYRITMELASRWGNCISIKDVLEQLNACMSSAFVSHQDNRSIVGREKAEYIFVSEPKVECTYGVAKMVQQGQEVSGDSFRAGRCSNDKFVLALSDGMGSGRAASIESETVVDLLFQFVEAGFAMDVALRLMNAAMIFGAEKERYSTLDACIVDEYTGIIEFYKVGAHVSFVRRKNHVEVIGAESLPMGSTVTIDTIPNRSYLEPGDYLVMVTDGVLEYLHVDNPIGLLQDLIGELQDADAATFSRKIMERVMLFTGGVVKDDMTVLTLKTTEKR